MIHYPRISKGEHGGFGLEWRLPEEYKEWVKKITPEFREGIKRLAGMTQKRFGLIDYNGAFPHLNWKEDGLAGIVIGTGCPCAQLDENTYYFHNIDTSSQALALVEMLSIYLNFLQGENETQKT